MGWLLGSYTVLRWPGLRPRLLLRRLALTSLTTGLAMVLMGWVFNAPDSVLLLHRLELSLALVWLSFWSLGVRLMLRRIRMAPGTAIQLPMMAPAAEARMIAREWLRSPYARRPRMISPAAINHERFHRSQWHQLSLLAGSKLAPDEKVAFDSIQHLGVKTTTLEHLAGTQLERLPPSMLPDHWLEYSDLRWSDVFSLQRKIKRFADMIVASFLLLITAPVLILSALAIWLEDGGPVFYVQQRSGWLGQPFKLYKLRTMSNQVYEDPPCWTMSSDHRITWVGRFLRPSRLDELPQLVNVLRGEMSLIGPRPERPELETQLEESIPHYRKRHWMPPGLSGWAQVCAPYAASVEEAELKLSYDLFYLRHWSTGLDLLILVKTIKTVLKGAGR